MVIDIETLTDTLKIEDESEKKSHLVEMVLEAIALSKDNEVMNDLMIEMLHKNAILHKQLEEQLSENKKLSVTDQLTGLYNRRYLLEAFEKEVNRLKRYNRTFALIMFDIDFFKLVNDNYGHDVGDRVLKDLASLVSSRLRKSDTFSRWGGEEFMILAGEMDVESARILAEDIREKVEDYDFSPVTSLTCSFGVMTCNDPADCEMKVMTKQVDLALYKAKATGRNKVVVYEEEVKIE